jgi:hypothetical protein
VYIKRLGNQLIEQTESLIANVGPFVDQLNGNLNSLFLPLFQFGDSLYLAIIAKEVQEIREIF